MQPKSLSIRTRAALMTALSAAAFGVAAQTATPATPATPAMPDRGAAADIAFVRADVNKDGKVTKDEVAKLPALASKFVDLDKDKDGALSKEEFAMGYTAKN
jgi:hypothetical protein